MRIPGRRAAVGVGRAPRYREIMLHRNIAYCTGNVKRLPAIGNPPRAWLTFGRSLE